MGVRGTAGLALLREPRVRILGALRARGSSRAPGAIEMSLDPRMQNRPRMILRVLAAAGLAFAIGCGIDDHSSDGTSSGGTTPTAPDISGLYDGFFFSRETDEAIPIDQAVFIRTATSSYQVDFDIDTGEGTDPVANALELVLNLARVDGVVQTDGALYIEAAQGLVIMNGQVRGTRIEGDWLLNFPQEGGGFIEDSGTWEIFRRSR